eukprot:CAMPEP_0115855964 /NCGR_PEP_ID=MMETSP0287-20121206/14810_1 /TAXON_ID=412157 /ORGANISM="Chrysochromulina rotalis, Strain UIO044" /LENGTH=117 /DNA_ID=CAMNT_0003310127 /DNA_START=331 /DNA_END=684 /DNA_ORIENTATION=-
MILCKMPQVDARAQLDFPDVGRRDHVAVVLGERRDHADLRPEEHGHGEQRRLIPPRAPVLRHLRQVARPVADAHRIFQKEPFAHFAIVHRAIAVRLKPLHGLLTQLHRRPAAVAYLL